MGFFKRWSWCSERETKEVMVKRVSKPRTPPVTVKRSAILQRSRKRPTSPQLQRGDHNTVQAGNYGGKTSKNEKAGSPENDNHPRSTAKRRRTVFFHSPPTTIIHCRSCRHPLIQNGGWKEKGEDGGQQRTGA